MDWFKSSNGFIIRYFKMAIDPKYKKNMIELNHVNIKNFPAN